MLREYYRLTKPGIIYGNVLTAIGGFLFASQGVIDWWLLLALATGTSFVIGSACVINNYIDRHIDQKMVRTKQRASASGKIPVVHAMAYALILGVGGFMVLGLWTNLTTLVVGIVGFVDYLVFYSIYKRRSTVGTAVGAIAGATPIVAGYTAVTGEFDTNASILFLILVAWQMAHFYSIAIFRAEDYRAAHIPVLPVVKGMARTRVEIISFILLFIIAAIGLTFFGTAGYVYLLIVIVLGVGWLRKALQPPKKGHSELWARYLFLFSLKVILGLSVALALDAWLP